MNFILERIHFNQKFIFDEPEKSYSCGRGRGNALVCVSLVVSRDHCVFLRRKDKLYVTDFKSANGTFINGISLRPYQTTELHNNDIVGIGCADIESNDEAMFMYKVCILQSSFPMSQMNCSDMSKTVVKDKASPKKAVEKKRKVENNDIVIPSKLPKYTEAHSSTHDVFGDNNINPIVNATENEASNNIHMSGEDTDGDIQVIQSLFEINVKDENVNQCDGQSENCLENNNNSDISSNKCQHLRKSKKKFKNKNMDISFEKDTEDNNCDNKKVTEVDTTENKFHSHNEINFNENKTNNTHNIQHCKIKEELQITDDEEVLCVATSSKLSCNTTSVKIKQEQTYSSENNAIDPSNNENEILPHFTFDMKFDDKVKMEIKEQPVNNDIDFIKNVITVSDSEDEDNPWLHRLSRSQLINEDKNPDTKDLIIKDEIDLGIWEEDEISLISSEIPSTSKSVDVPTNNVNISKILAVKGTIPECEIGSVNTKVKIVHRDENDINLSAIESNAMNINNTDSATNEINSENIDPINVQEAGMKQNVELDNRAEISNDASSLFNKKQAPVLKTASATKTRKLIPIIEAQHLPLRKNRARKKSYNEESSSVKNHRTAEENSKKLSKENKLQKSEEKRGHQLCNERRRDKKHSERFVDGSLSNLMSDNRFIPKEEKQILIQERNAKLRKLTEKDKELSVESNQNVKRGTAKPKVKVTLKNRGDFLTQEQTNVSEAAQTVNKSAKQKESAQHAKSAGQKNYNSKRTAYEELNSEIDTSKNSTISGQAAKSQGKHTFKESVNDIVSSLEQSLRLNQIEVPEKNNIKDPVVIDNAKEQCSNHNSNKKKAHENIGHINNCTKTIPELQEKCLNELEFAPGLRKKIISPSKSAVTSKIKKRVSFSDNVNIRDYEIEPNNSMKKLQGKDAPIPTNKLSQTICNVRSPKLEEFLVHIFAWNPLWLEEQRYWKDDRLIVSELQFMKLRYDNFSHYYNIMKPLLLLEMWHVISKDFELLLSKNKQNKFRMCSVCPASITQVPILSSNMFLTEMLIEILVTKDEYYKHNYSINRGDLVSLEYVMYSNGAESFNQIFCYITHMKNTSIIGDFTYYNKELRNYMKNAYAVVTYQVYTRNLERERILAGRLARIRKIAYLRSNIRLVQALQYLPQSPLSKLILNPKIDDYQLPNLKPSHTYKSLVTKDKLNMRQMEAVFKVTETVLKNESKLCLIQGPPGTGKTKVIVNMVTQILHDQPEVSDPDDSIKILICAPSNTAVDEIVLRLLAVRSKLRRKFKMVRIGRPEQINARVNDISSTELTKRFLRQTAESSACLSGANTANLNADKKKLMKEMDELKKKAANHTQLTPLEKNRIRIKLNHKRTRFELLDLGKLFDMYSTEDRYRYQRDSEENVIARAHVIACTLSTCYTNQMEAIFGPKKERFSVCIVDEASQSCEAETLIPLLLGVQNLVLVGDPNQLPATILSQRAKKLGLDRSIFARIQHAFSSHANNPIIMLDVQYRMAYAISYWPNRYFYESKLKNAIESKQTFPFQPYRVLNHTFAQNNDRFSNTTEAEFVANIIYAMLTFAKWDDIHEPITLGILTPYNNQRTLMTDKIMEKTYSLPSAIKKRIVFEVNTVDGFQGQKRDIIIMSCVRSHGIGFLSDKQRLCVALTRAKHSLIICGNFMSMKDPMWNALLADARSRGILFDINADATPSMIKSFIIK